MAENNAGYKISLEQDVLDFNSEKKPTVNNFTPGDIRIDGVYSGGLETKIKLENASVEINNIPMDHETLCKLEQKDPRVDCIDIKSDVEKYNGIVKTECKDANVKTEFVEQVEIIKEEPKVSEKNEFLHLEMKPKSSVKTESDTEDIEFENEEEFLSGDEFLSDNEGRDTTGLSSSEDEEDTTASSLNENLKELVKLDNPLLSDIVLIYRRFNELWNKLETPTDERKCRLMQEMLFRIKMKLHLQLTSLELEQILTHIHKIVAAEKKRRFKCELKSQKRTAYLLFFQRCKFLTSHIGPFRCRDCSAIIKHYEQFREHKSQHDNNECNICGQVCPNKKSLKEHKAQKHNVVTYICSLCNVSFADAKQLKIHSNLNHRYKCEKCCKSFTSRRRKENHNKRIHVLGDGKSLQCKICGKICHNPEHEGKKFPCTSCGVKVYTRYSSMKRHLIKCKENLTN